MWKVTVNKDNKVIRTRHFSTEKKAKKYMMNKIDLILCLINVIFLLKR
jgi:hypothetical protein